MFELIHFEWMRFWDDLWLDRNLVATYNEISRHTTKAEYQCSQGSQFAKYQFHRVDILHLKGYANEIFCTLKVLPLIKIYLKM